MIDWLKVFELLGVVTTCCRGSLRFSLSQLRHILFNFLLYLLHRANQQKRFVEFSTLAMTFHRRRKLKCLRRISSLTGLRQAVRVKLNWKVVVCATDEGSKQQCCSSGRRGQCVVLSVRAPKWCYTSTYMLLCRMRVKWEVLGVDDEVSEGRLRLSILL